MKHTSLRRSLPLLLALVACRRREEAQPPPAQAPRPTPPSPMQPVNAMQPVAAPTQPPPGVLCTATPASSFHLRPTVTEQSIGPELPAGTAVGVVSVDADMTRRGTQMYTVKVLSDGATGHIFLTANELAQDCPASVRDPATTIACQETCATPRRAEHTRCLTECTNSGERGSECLDSCQDDTFIACMRQQCHVEEPTRMW